MNEAQNRKQNNNNKKIKKNLAIFLLLLLSRLLSLCTAEKSPIEFFFFCVSVCLCGVRYFVVYLEALEEFVILFSDARRPLPIRFGVFVKIAGVTIIADFGHDGWLHVQTARKEKTKFEIWRNKKI